MKNTTVPFASKTQIERDIFIYSASQNTFEFRSCKGIQVAFSESSKRKETDPVVGLGKEHNVDVNVLGLLRILPVKVILESLGHLVGGASRRPLDYVRSIAFLE
jgi:hypothetical protein